MLNKRFRFFWPVLCGFLAMALVGSTVYLRKQIRTATQRKKNASAAQLFDKREAAYFKGLAVTLGYETGPSLTGSDAARIAAYTNIEQNKLHSLSGTSEPTTFPSRNLPFTQRVALPLTPTVQLPLGTSFTHYRYDLINKSDRALPAPVLFQGDRWDSASAMIAAAGFPAIHDEIERAVAIWRFVCPRRVFGDPPTEGKEEHDVVKYLALYGYGFCDDSARAMATLAELSGLRSRIWELDGHVVAEVFASGKWRMLDADQQAYFHRAGAPKDILCVEELAADPNAFANIVSFRGATEYSKKYAACFSSRENNKIAASGTAEHEIQPVLRAGERVAFTNYNWGRYFLGKYPTPPPRFYNGCFEYFLHPGDLVAGAGKIMAEAVEHGYRLSNRGMQAGSVELPFSYPFPIVGGEIAGTALVEKGRAVLEYEDRDHGRVVEQELSGNMQISLDHRVAILSPEPTYRYSLIFKLEPGTILELRDFKVTSDFQFARLALLALQPGANEFRVHFPEGSDPAAFELVVSTK